MSLNDLKKLKISIKGISSFGGGSLLVKRRLLDDIKVNLKKYLILDNYEITTEVKFFQDSQVNLRETKIFNSTLNSTVSDESSINNEEFNIFISTDEGKTSKLIATSDWRNKDSFFKFLQEGIGRRERETFILQMTSKLIDIINNIK